MGQGLALVERKLAPPRGRSGIVVRRRLLARLRTTDTVPVVAIAAPPGYGKTTLLSQWVEGDRRELGWLSLDERDDNPATLLGSLVTILDRIQPLDAAILAELTFRSRTIHDVALSHYRAMVASIRVPFLLVFDDAHVLRNPEAVDILVATVEELPEGCQVAVASRDIPPLPLAQLRARGRLVEFGSDDLALDVDEADELLRGVGAPLLSEDVRRLTQRTEGWPAGMYLAALSIQASGSTAAVHATVSGTDRFVTDYLRSELLSRLDPDVVAFLRSTSVLGELSGPLVDYVLDTTGSAARLEALERSNLFVVPLDRTRDWFRYHALFRELLMAELRADDPSQAAVLMGRAADWYEEHDAPERALTTALTARDLERAARLIAKIGPATIWAGRLTDILDWLQRFGDQLDRFPDAAVLGGWAAIAIGDGQTAERLAEAATSAQRAQGRTVAGLHPLRAVLLRDGLAAGHTDAELGLESAPPGDPFRPQALLGLATILEAEGDDDGADRRYAELTEVPPRGPDAPARTTALAIRARRAIDRGDWGSAEGFVRRAWSIVAASQLEDYISTAFVAAAAARIAIHHGDRRRAGQELVHAQRLRTGMTVAQPLLAVEIRIAIAYAYLSLGDTAGALTMTTEAEEIRRQRPDLGNWLARLAELRTRIAHTPVALRGASTLTPAELRLLPYLPTHLSYPEIGARFDLSANTIKTQAGSIYAKLDARNRAEAVDRARAIGLLES